jgi:N-acetylmuramic acid 6-phosphate etherase
MDQFTQNFWQEYQRFLKTMLTTEQPHPQTAGLSMLAQKDMAVALALLFAVDAEAIIAFKSIDLAPFNKAINTSLQEGGRIFLVGCGASARMAMQIEFLCRQRVPDSNQVKAVIAGGDIALIEAVERCEDEPSFAIKHLEALGLSRNDLVIGLSAGGESPFILEAIRYASTLCTDKPWLLYCNPATALITRNEHHVITNPMVAHLCLDVGPMALTGSTRMQATTVMTLALLSAFFGIESELEIFLDKIKHLPLQALASFAEYETSLYQQKEHVLYHVSAQYSLSILADTTERSPTFNVPTFEHGAQKTPAWAYMMIDGSHDKVDAWQQLLLRAPEVLNWPDLPQTAQSYLDEFDLSSSYHGERRDIYFNEVADGLSLQYADKIIPLDMTGLSVSMRQLLLRLIMVNHSTAVFGRLGFYQGNLMTFVKPSNFKLVDRAVRYIQFLAQAEYKKQLSYREVAEFVLAERVRLSDKVSIVSLGLEHFVPH